MVCQQGPEIQIADPGGMPHRQPQNLGHEERESQQRADQPEQSDGDRRRAGGMPKMRDSEDDIHDIVHFVERQQAEPDERQPCIQRTGCSPASLDASAASWAPMSGMKR